MIWIATLCLLAIAAWLLFNGINERRWVQAHSHDETVAADEGFLPNFSTLVEKRRVDADGKLAIGDENTRFAKAVKKVQEKTDKASARFESAAQKVRDREDSGVFARSVDKVKGASEKVGGKLDERMRLERMKGEEAPAGQSIAEEGGLFGKAVAKVTERTDAVGQKLAESARRRSGGDRTTLADEDSLFARTVNKVSGGMQKVEGKLDERARNAHAGDAQTNEDFLTRMSQKVGKRVNELDERIVERSKDVQNKVDRS